MESGTSDSYEPAWRRPIAGGLRATAKFATDCCVRLGIHPNTVSLLSIAASAGAGACFLFSGSQPWLLIPGALLCYMRLWLNMLDGMVALAGGQASRWGEILNDLPDRASDVLIFVGVAHSGLVNPFLAYWVALGSLLVAYVGTFGQAVGVQREFSGLMAKPWRMVALHFGAWITLAQIWWGGGHARVPGSDLTWLDLTCTLILVGCVQTIWLRLARILGALREETR